MADVLHFILAFPLQGEHEVGTDGKLLLLAMEDGSFDAVDIYNREKVPFKQNSI